MLPLPGSPGTSWASFTARIRGKFAGASPRVCVAFWLFGLINNVLYVIILSAALDLVGPNVPKGVVLLADVIPSFLTKLVAPYFIHLVPYEVRILIFAVLSAVGMGIVALSPAYTTPNSAATVIPGASGSSFATSSSLTTLASSDVALKLFGVMLASLSSGGGELSFLGLVHYYGEFSLAAWGSGTGGAGLIGAGAYALATTSLGLSVKSTLLASAFLPVIMLMSFFMILPLEPLRHARQTISTDEVEREGLLADDPDNEQLSTTHSSTNISEDISRIGSYHSNIQNHDHSFNTNNKRMVTRNSQELTVTANPYLRTSKPTFSQNLSRARKLFAPYMLPLLLVYIAEYTINQGVSPTLLFPLPETPFRHYRAFYPTYNAIYQVGVFISRSSTPFFRVHNLYAPSFLQILNLVVLTAQSLYGFIPSVWIVFLVVFWEGLLGGLVYVNTFAEISEKVPTGEREFSLSATTVSDSAGICVAGFVSMVVEVWLCDLQVRGGRDWCRRL